MKTCAALILTVLLVGCSRAPVPGGPVLYEGARLITPDSVIEDSAFVTEGGTFKAVGKRGEVQAPAGAAKVSLSGKTVIPALIDAHAHLGWAVIKTSAINKETYSRANLIDHLRRAAYYGISATRNLGTDVGDIAYGIRSTPTPGAALLRTAGRGMAMPNAGPGADYWRPVAYGVTNDAEARAAVRELAALKADVVKLWVDDRNKTVKKLTPELRRAIIDEAHKNGMKTIAHIFYLEDAKDLLKAGIDAFAHGVRDVDVDDEFMSLIKARPDVYVIPNLPDNPDQPLDAGWLAETIPVSEIQKLQDTIAKRTPEATKTARDFFGVQARNLAKINAAGVKIVFGTDSGTSVGWFAHAELADLATAGMTPAQILVAATKSSADVLKLNDRGSVASGKVADFVVLDANPLDDIKNSRRISRVFFGGEELDRAAMRVEFGGKK